MLILSVLWATLAAFLPVSNDCGAALSQVSEPGIRQVWVRSRPVGATAWRDTMRWSVTAAVARGGLAAIPFVHSEQPMERQVCPVDSAGNLARCWSNTVVK